MPNHGIDAIIQDRGDGPHESDPRRLPADPGTSEPSNRAADHNAVDTSPRDDKRVEPPKLGGAARSREDDRGPFEITKSPVDVKAELSDLGILGGLLGFLG